MPGSGFPLETGDGPILLRLLCLDIGTDALLCMSQLGRGCSISLLWLRHPPRIDNARRSNRSCMILYVLIFRVSVPPFYVWTTRRLRQRLWAFDHTFGNAFQSSHADSRKPNLPKQNKCDASDIKIGLANPVAPTAMMPKHLTSFKESATPELEILQHPATLILDLQPLTHRPTARVIALNLACTASASWSGHQKTLRDLGLKVF